jgi:hypothetical protein
VSLSVLVEIGDDLGLALLTGLFEPGDDRRVDPVARPDADRRRRAHAQPPVVALQEATEGGVADRGDRVGNRVPGLGPRAVPLATGAGIFLAGHLHLIQFAQALTRRYSSLARA